MGTKEKAEAGARSDHHFKTCKHHAMKTTRLRRLIAISAMLYIDILQCSLSIILLTALWRDICCCYALLSDVGISNLENAP